MQKRRNSIALANAIPIYKDNKEYFFTNYYPVSALPIFSKVLKMLMFWRLITFIDKHKLFMITN